MNITWLGQSAFKIEFKTATGDSTLLIDPYKHPKEDMPRNLGADVALTTRGRAELITLTKEPFIIDDAGEYEYKQVLVYGFQTNFTKHAPLVFRLEVEHVSISHLGLPPAALREELVDELNGVDVLMLPIGGGSTITAERAAELVTKIEPRIIIPYAFRAKGTGAEYSEATAFIKAIGLSAEIQPKIKITRKDLPTDIMVVGLLEKT